jgi:polysaccharide biosynthesis/export protein
MTHIDQTATLHHRRSLLRRSGIAVWTTALASLGLVSCEPGSHLPPIPPAPVTAYRLGPDDVIRVITFGESQLTGEFRIDDRGNIAVPLLGLVHAGGLSTGELENRIEAGLRQHKVILNPSVSVDIVSYRPIFILGEVKKPGQYPFEPGMTVLSAVAIAGGFTYRAVTDYASIVRNVNGQTVEGRAGRDALIAPGDVINVFERIF